jgi:enterochelin esterase-like enzyme
MEPTNTTLITVVCVLAVLAPIGTAVLLAGRRTGTPRHGWLLRALKPLLLVIVCQVLAVAAVFLVVNRSYGFYNTWDDLLGRQTNNPEPLQLDPNSLDAGKGRIETLSIDGTVSHVHGQALVWLPPGYSADDTAKKYPVVMMLPGQPSSPQVVYNEYHFGDTASQEIETGQVKPFVAVFPPIMINPPRDTECVNVPNGPQAESWLTEDVPKALTASYHVQPLGKQWSVFGWSTGGLCAAKLTLKYPKLFGAAVSFGGEMLAYEDHTTGDLWGGSAENREQNSPLALYKLHLGTRGSHLLIVTGIQDSESYPHTKRFLEIARGDPYVSVITFPKGGHTSEDYNVYLPTALRWLAQTGGLG